MTHSPLVTHHLSQTSRGGSPILKSFLLKLFISGSVWFVTFPLMVWLANLSPHYHRHRIVVVGTLFTQTLCLALLAHQFLAESSTYQRLSTVRLFLKYICFVFFWGFGFGFDSFLSHR